MEGSWPVKGFVSCDLDGDDLPEIITYADQIMYPPAHQEARYPFPGCIFIDWDEDKNEFTVHPLIWGKWGENICSNVAAIQTVIPISAKFRSDGYKGDLKDLLVRTQTNFSANKCDSRLFVLEQPDASFTSCDYRNITPDSIDTDSVFPTDPFYVHRFYLVTDGGDFELYFPYSDSGFPNVVSSGCCANIFDYDNDGLFDLFVTIEYLDNDNNAFTRYCGTSVQIYHRLPAIGNRKYRFKLAFRRDIAGISFGAPIPADLNGDASDGKEGWLMPVRIDTSMSNELNTVPGIASVYRDGDTWKIQGTHPDSTSLIQYAGTYSGVCVFDVDNDGYEDAVVKLDKEPKVVPYSPSEKYMTGDLKLFRNMRGENRSYEELFTHGPEGSQVLWADDAFSWDVHMENFDDDGKPELGCALARREPAWGNVLGKYGIYYTDLKWVPSGLDDDIGKISNNGNIQLYQNYPNPFNNFTFICFNLITDDYISLELYNLDGRFIKSIHYGLLQSGDHRIIFDGNDLKSGIYFYKLHAGDQYKFGKMIYIK